MASSTARRILGATVATPFSTRETVERETPARRATSSMVGGTGLLVMGPFIALRSSNERSSAGDGGAGARGPDPAVMGGSAVDPHVVHEHRGREPGGRVHRTRPVTAHREVQDHVEVVVVDPRT